MENNHTISPEQTKILEEEQQLLIQVKQGLLMLAVDEKQNNLNDVNFNNIIELRDSLADTLPEDVPAVMAQMERLVLLHTHQDSHKAASGYNLDTPYFAHIRLRENKRERDLLIGNQNCFSTHLPCPIVDWKNAPISQIFYRYNEGEEYVEEVGERELEGVLIVRRMLLIENGTLMRINWPGGVLEDFSKKPEKEMKWHLVSQKTPQLESGPEKTLDELKVPEELSSNSGQTTDLNFSGYRVDKHLRQITALVDPQQFNVITHSESGIVLIQGGAGSGKTTVALHRLAYLMSKKPQYFKPKTVLPIVFGPALANYMSKVLPALGVNGVRPRTYHKWVSGLRKRMLPELPSSYAENTPMDVIELKRHPLWLKYYREEIEKRTLKFRKLFEDKLVKVEELDLVLEAWDALSELVLIPRLLYLVRWSKGEDSIENVPGLSSSRMEKQLQKVLEHAFPELFEAPHLLTSQIWNDCLVRQELLFETVERLAPGVFSETQLTSACSWAVRQYQKRLEAGELIESDRVSLTDPVEGLGSINLNFADEKALLDEEDDTLLLLLYQLLMGPLQRKNGKQLNYTHLMLDEAQDFGPLEFQLLVSLTPEELPSVTLAGDLDQRIMIGRRHETWGESLGHLTLPNGSKPDITALDPLKIGYRSTHEIMTIAKQVIGEHSVNTVWHSTRHGAPVDVFRFRERGAMVAFLADTLKDLSIREPLASVAVLARTQESAKILYEGLLRTDLVGLRFISDQEFSFTPGIDVTDISQTKGLEFDSVIIADADASTYGPDIRSRQLLYVGVTRAAHQLWIMHCGNPSSLIAGIREESK
ncbi:MAG: AAA family ATPase [SAR324 cluster bacterium]|nr:AAA family ATPase [SAR324 cluster bacterium]MBL7035379.1 AAA family ATPase [SAR324 cluster bacterium]